MHSSARLLAQAVDSLTGTPSLLKSSPLALLPPIPLYRRILRAHRRFLPVDARVLGDQYVKSEFRAHQKVENPIHIVSICPVPLSAIQHSKRLLLPISLMCHMLREGDFLTNHLQIGFLSEWQMYVQQVEGDSWRDAKMDKGKIDKMSGLLSLISLHLNE